MYLEGFAMVSGRLYRVLLVDDDLNCLDAIGQILRRDGYEVILVAEGKQALEMINNSIIDIAIVDFNLPDIDGIHVLYEIKKRGNIPIIMMTSETSKEVKLASFEAGAYSFVTKPINIPIFRNIVSKALEYSEIKSVRREMILIKWIREIIHR